MEKNREKLGWNSVLSIGTKDKQYTIASFSACFTGNDDDDDDEDEYGATTVNFLAVLPVSPIFFFLLEEGEKLRSGLTRIQNSCCTVSNFPKQDVG